MIQEELSFKQQQKDQARRVVREYAARNGWGEDELFQVESSLGLDEPATMVNSGDTAPAAFNRR